MSVICFQRIAISAYRSSGLDLASYDYQTYVIEVVRQLGENHNFSAVCPWSNCNSCERDYASRPPYAMHNPSNLENNLRKQRKASMKRREIGVNHNYGEKARLYLQRQQTN